MKLSFVIPCYRSERTLEGVVAEIGSVVSQWHGGEYEIIMVSDCSPDGVYQVIERLCMADPRHLKGLELARNFGQHAALMAGFARASGDVVFSVDDDGQAPVDAIPAVVEKLASGGHDVVFGAYPEKKHSLFRNLGSKANDLMSTWLIGKPMSLRISSFFAVRRFVIDEMVRYSGPFPYILGLMLRVTRKVADVEVQHRARIHGSSGYSFSKLLGLWINGFTAFSVKPLRLASYLGIGCAAGGFLFGVWTIVNKLVIHPLAPVGYSSLMSVMLFIGGVLMLILGLIGEYVGRIYICINQSPQYVISRETGHVCCPMERK